MNWRPILFRLAGREREGRAIPAKKAPASRRVPLSLPAICNLLLAASIISCHAVAATVLRLLSLPPLAIAPMPCHSYPTHEIMAVARTRPRLSAIPKNAASAYALHGPPCSSTSVTRTAASSPSPPRQPTGAAPAPRELGGATTRRARTPAGDGNHAQRNSNAPRSLPLNQPPPAARRPHLLSTSRTAASRANDRRTDEHRPDVVSISHSINRVATPTRFTSRQGQASQPARSRVWRSSQLSINGPRQSRAGTVRYDVWSVRGASIPLGAPMRSQASSIARHRPPSRPALETAVSRDDAARTVISYPHETRWD